MDVPQSGLMSLPRMSHLLTNSVIEIVGPAEAALLSGSPSPFDLIHLAETKAKLEARYGVESTAGLLWRIGRSFFRGLIISMDGGSGLLQPDLRFLPFRRKAPAGLAILAELFSGLDGQKVSLSSGKGLYYWRVESCLECRRQEEGHRVCTFFPGLVQEYLSWIGSGRSFLVEELGCIGRGEDACLIKIDPNPVG